MDSDTKQRNHFLITGFQNDLISQFEYIDIPLQVLSQEPKVDWCLQNYAEITKQETLVDTIDLLSSAEEDLDIEIEHRNDKNREIDFDVETEGHDLIQLIESEHQCLVCKKSYDKKKSLGDHLREVHSAYNLTCNICGQLYHGRRAYNRHVTKHSKIKKLPNEKMKSEAIENLKIRKVNLQARVKEFVDCSICPAILTSNNALATHIRTVHWSGSYKCEICGSVLKCRNYLHAHMRRVHSKEFVNCEFCGKEFRSRRYLRIHIRNSH